MKLFYISFLSIFFLFSQTVLAVGAVPSASTSVVCSITTTQRVGSRGAEVACLQASLAGGLIVDSIFGPKTQAVVKVWQASKDLVADGIVGPLSRAVFNRVMANGGVYPVGCTSNIGYSVTTGFKCDSNLKLPVPVASNLNLNAEKTNQNPNLENLDLYIAAVKKGVLKGGLSESQWPPLEAKIRKQAEDGPDFRQEFFNIQKAIYDKKVSEKILKMPVLAFLEKIIDEAFVTKKVMAASNLPFGGYLTYVNPEICDCPPGLITQVFVELPGAPTGISNMLLDYRNGSQIYLNYNIPEPGIAVLGFYTPGVQSCYTYSGNSCVLVESDGLISPEVGSSL